MPYSIDRYNGTTISVVEDGTIDSTLDLKLIGKNYAGYGEAQNENFVWLLENFSSPNSPPRPLSGQLWYDSGTKKLKFFDNTKWRTTGGAEVADQPPAGLTIGDLWWDTANEQMHTWNGTEFVLVGPQGVAGQGATLMKSRSVKDETGAVHAIIEALADGVSIFIVSPDEFRLGGLYGDTIEGFTTIKQGITLCYTPDTGITTSQHVYWGTASNSLKLDGFGADEFLRATNPVFTTLVRFYDPGFTVGTDNDLAVYIQNGNIPVIKNALGDTILFQTTVNGAVVTPLSFVGPNIIPGANEITDIGTAALKYKTIFARTFDGAATRADSVNVGGTYRAASLAASANTIAVRDSSGNITANLFVGTATSARYADLAEKYLTDAEYPVGTVVAVGGEKEVTAAGYKDLAIGVISGSPAFMMNSALEGGQFVALKGRVPVMVSKEVNKGDRLIAASNGTAIALKWSNNPEVDAQYVFAVALETCNNSTERLVEAIIL
jgi:hypothetical protein